MALNLQHFRDSISYKRNIKLKQLQSPSEERQPISDDVIGSGNQPDPEGAPLSKPVEEERRSFSFNNNETFAADRIHLEHRKRATENVSRGEIPSLTSILSSSNSLLTMSREEKIMIQRRLQSQIERVEFDDTLLEKAVDPWVNSDDDLDEQSVIPDARPVLEKMVALQQDRQLGRVSMSSGLNLRRNE